MSRIMIMAGGTGGHVVPALAVAHYLRAHEHEVVWVGTKDGLEAKLVPQAGFELKIIHIKGMRRSGLRRLLVMPFRLAWAMLQMLWLVGWHKPKVLLGMGGFVSAPGGFIAKLLRKPLIVHEQNAIAGMTNRHLARSAARVLSGFPSADGIEHFTWVGNPVRQEIIDIPEPQKRLEGRSGALRVLVIGGSQGANVFNQRLPHMLAQHGSNLEVWHQCGHGTAAEIGAVYLAAGIGCEVNGFIDDMAKAYAWCDVAICRAGAMTISEVCAAGVASILVPYPYAVSDHQTRNAMYLHSHRAAHVVQQEAFVGGEWLKYIDKFENDRGQILNKARAARRLARVDAAAQVAQACIEVGMNAPSSKTSRVRKKDMNIESMNTDMESSDA